MTSLPRTHSHPDLTPCDPYAAPDEILAATAHELRLPVSHIKGFVSSLLRADVDWDQATRREFLAEIDTETDRLAQLIDTLLATRSGNGAGAPKTELMLISPARLVEGGLHRVRGLLDERPLRIDVPEGLPCVWVDASRIERVLANLLQNAVNYSPPGSAVGVSARRTDDGELELSVDDEGPGVPAQDRERIFEPFVRTQPTEASKVPGHGLGLAISQSIVRAHGGRIQVSDRPGGGARFTVLLPTAHAQPYFTTRTCQ